MKKKIGIKKGAPTALGHDPLAWIDAEESAASPEVQEDKAAKTVAEETLSEIEVKKVIEDPEKGEVEQQDKQNVTVADSEVADEAESDPQDEQVEVRGPQTVSLEDSLGIAQVEVFHKTLLSTLNSATEIEIDVSRLQQIDAAGVQLLYAFVHDAQNRGLNISWKSTSEALEKSAEQLGLSESLGL